MYYNLQRPWVAKRVGASMRNVAVSAAVSAVLFAVAGGVRAQDAEAQQANYRKIYETELKPLERDQRHGQM